MKRKRRNHSASFKAKVALAAIRGDKTLAPYEDWLRRRVESAAPVRLPASVLHREIAAMGFDGTARTVQRFVAALYPEPAPEPVVRFETAPGHQAQMDWGEYRLDRRKVYAFVGILCYSRWLYLEYVDSMRSEALLACHQRMLADFGGIPREILYDNMKTVVTQRDAYGRGRHRFQDAIWAFAHDWMSLDRRCRPCLSMPMDAMLAAAQGWAPRVCVSSK